jgi:hypothetical protein
VLQKAGLIDKIIPYGSKTDFQEALGTSWVLNSGEVPLAVFFPFKINFYDGE